MEFSRREAVGAGLALTAGVAMAVPSVQAAVPAAPSPRRRERLAEWRFHLGHATAEERDFGYGRYQQTYAKAGSAVDVARPKYDDAGWRPVRVPHDWAVELPFAEPARAAAKTDEADAAAHGFKAIGRNFPENSVGWYRTPLAIAADDRTRSIWLEFDGVFRDATVLVNGYVVARNASGYAPFAVPIGDFLNYDGSGNVLAVRVDASFGEGWFYEGAGIYRHVDLVRADGIHVPQWGSVVRPAIEAGGASVAVAIDVRNDRAEPAEIVVRQSILGTDDRTVATVPDATVSLAPQAQSTVEGSARIAAPRLWSVDDPALYRLRTELVVGGTVVDRYDTRFGIRTVTFDGEKGFALNGRTMKLLGVCNHQDHAGVGTGIPDALHGWRIDRTKEMGGNAWRSAHNPPAGALLDLCDEKGMLMIVETRRNSSDPESIDELDRVVRRDRNHPSVILWSLGNEEPHQGTDRGARITSAMQARVRALDPTRQTTFAFDHSWDKGAAKVVDVVGTNYHMERVEAFHQRFPTIPLYGSETASTVATRGGYANDAEKHIVRAYDTEHPPWAATAEEWWPLAATHPYISGGFIWTGFDYRGEPTPYAQWPSISSYFGVMDTCGFPKDNYYYYRAWWRPDRPLVHLLPHWNWPGREGQPIEVWVHGNSEEVELLLNGRSLGRKAMPRNRHLAWQVPYAPGRLEARGYTGGRRDAIDARETVGRPAAVVLTADRRTPTADGDDVVILRAEIVDARGRMVPDAGNLLRFAIEAEGDAQVIGVGNGDPTSLEADVASQRRAFGGLAQAIVRIGRTPGALRLSATADGLAPGRLVVNALAPRT